MIEYRELTEREMQEAVTLWLKEIKRKLVTTFRDVEFHHLEGSGQGADIGSTTWVTAKTANSELKLTYDELVEAIVFALGKTGARVLEPKSFEISVSRTEADHGQGTCTVIKGKIKVVS